jgi:hypothetical protein
MKQNRRLPFYVWGTLLLVLLLISGLPNVTVAPNRLFSLAFLNNAADLIGYEALMRMVLLLGIPLLIILGILFLPGLRSRRTLVALVAIGLLLLLFMWITSKATVIETTAATPVPTAPSEQEEIIEEETAVEEFPLSEPAPLVPPWVSTLVSAAMLLFFLVLLSFIIWYFWPAKELVVSPPLFEISQEAEEALSDLRSGANLRNVIVRCYLDMGHTVDRWRGIQRQQSMTPREFETTLAELGLPNEPIVNLTRLFEAVRYGTNEASPEDEATAVTSLTAILQACQELS